MYFFFKTNYMKNILKTFALFVLVIFFISSCDEIDQTVVSVTNPLNMERLDAFFVLERDDLVNTGLEIGDFEYPVVVDQFNDTLTAQLDDIDQDGEWDELFILATFQQNETRDLRISFSDEPHHFVERTNVRMAAVQEMEPVYVEKDTAFRIKGKDTKVTSKKFQMEGPAWENDVVAFRNYFDERNGIDIFGKLSRDMILNSVGTGEDYHSMQNWGMDILKVGNSLGAGGIALLVDGELHRIGESSEGTFELITEGPARSIFSLNFTNWSVNGSNIDVAHVVQIVAGVDGYHSRVLVDGLGQPQKLVAGIVNIDSDSLHVLDINDQTVAIATHDAQAYNGERLGMALMFNKADYMGYETAPEEGEGITQTYYGMLELENNQPIDFDFYTAWEPTNPAYATEEDFIELVKFYAFLKQNPLVIDYGLGDE